jgi:hypothetical protein
VGRHQQSGGNCRFLCLPEAGKVLAGSKISSLGLANVTVSGMEADYICHDYPWTNQYCAVGIVKR